MRTVCSDTMDVLPAGDGGCQRARQIHHTTVAVSRSVEGRNVSTVALDICGLAKAQWERWESLNDSEQGRGKGIASCT